MKLFIYFCSAFIFISSSLFAQTNLSIGLYSGVLFSAFEDQDESITAIPVGGYLGMQVSENIEVGAEFSLLALPFEEKTTDAGVDVTTTLTQNLIGGYVRMYFPANTITPYVRAGVGYYTGQFEFTAGDFGGLSFDADFEGTIGFNIGAGIGSDSGLYAEFIYHILSQKIDLPGSGAATAYNNFGVQIGYAFSIN